MILGKLFTYAVNSISTFVGRMRAQSVPQCEIVGDSEGLPERFATEGFVPCQDTSPNREIFYPPSWINMADFKE